MTRAVCAVDTETLSLRWDRLAWEIAMVRRWPDGNVVECQFFLDVDLRRADPNALEVGGFWLRHPRGVLLSTGRKTADVATGLEVAAERIVRLTHDATIVGAQPWFDTHVLQRLLHGQGLSPSWHYRLVDVEALTAGHLGREVGGLANCAAALDVPFPEAEQHTALGDARCALRIHDRVMGGAS